VIDFGDRYQRTVCDGCDRPFPRDRMVIHPLCRDCRDEASLAALPPVDLDGDGFANS
jgi:hypothetical protein